MNYTKTTLILVIAQAIILAALVVFDRENALSTHGPANAFLFFSTVMVPIGLVADLIARLRS